MGQKGKLIGTRRALVILCALFVAGSVAPAGAQWDAARDFYVPASVSAAESHGWTSSAWQYGWASSLGSEFIPFTSGMYDGSGHSAYYGLLNWSLDPHGPWYRHYPLVVQNADDDPLAAVWSIKKLEPGGVGAHPGEMGEYSVVRWIAPWDSTYLIDASFDALKMASVDVHVLLNGVPVFSDDLWGRFGIEDSTRFTEKLSLRTGDRLDFAVGSLGNFNSDSTGLSARIQAVPEPGALLVAAGSLVSFGGALRRRRRSR